MRDLLIDKYGFSATDNSIVTLLGSQKWLIELEQYTSNVTVIFDSCDAGTGTKDIGPAAVVARSLPPNPNMPGAAGVAQAKGPVDKAGLLRGRARHSFISGSLPRIVEHVSHRTFTSHLSGASVGRLAMRCAADTRRGRIYR
jgi:hypothetical protein